MDRTNLPINKNIRRVKSDIVDNYNSSDLNIIDLPNGNRIKLDSRDVTSIITIGAKFMDSINNIKLIKSIGEQEVLKIKVEIEKIYAESDIQIKKMEQENVNWNNSFDRKKTLLFDLIDKINQNPQWSDDLKKTIIEVTSKIIVSE